MRWIPDNAVPLRRWADYSPTEVDALCEQRIVAFLQAKYGAVNYPVSTNDLTILIEQDADDLDLYADLSIFDGAIDGLTLFYAGARPRVRISAALSLDPGQELRLRAVLAHQLGHVLLHGDAGMAAITSTGCPANASEPSIGPAVPSATGTDSMEWQAHLASGAPLMPATAVDETVRQIWPEGALHRPVSSASPSATHLIDEVQRRFHVSQAAARDRLMQRLYLARDWDLAPAQHWTHPLTRTLVGGMVADVANTKRALLAENALLRQ